MEDHVSKMSRAQSGIQVQSCVIFLYYYYWYFFLSEWNHLVKTHEGRYWGLFDANASWCPRRSNFSWLHRESLILSSKINKNSKFELKSLKFKLNYSRIKADYVSPKLHVLCVDIIFKIKRINYKCWSWGLLVLMNQTHEASKRLN